MSTFPVHGFVNVGAALYDLALGIVVLSQSPRSKLHQAFFLTTLGAFMWVFGIGMESLVDWSRVYQWQAFSYLFGVPLISPSIYLFCRYFQNRSFDDRKMIWIFVVAVLLMVPMVFWTRSICIIKEYPWGRYPTPMPGWLPTVYYTIVMAFMVYFACRALSILFQVYRTAVSPQEKAQSRNVLIGFLIAYTGMADFGVSYGWVPYAFGYISLSIFISIIAYSILKHRLLEINFLLRKASLIFLVYAALLAFAIPTAYLAAERFTSVPSENRIALFGIGLFFGLILSLGPIVYANIIRHTFWLKSHLTQGLAHELKSPLSAIQSCLEACRNSLSGREPMMPDRMTDYLNIMDRSSARLQEAVHDLLNIVKIEEGSVTIDARNVSIRRLVEQAAEPFIVSGQKKGVEIHLQADEIFAWADEAKLMQVFSNLISNSLKFTHSGKITVKAGRNGRGIVCSVADTGKGIRQADKERIFIRFYQGDGATQGSGIGLSIAKAWVEAHGGKIWAESEGEGKGTTVTFTVPT